MDLEAFSLSMLSFFILKVGFPPPLGDPNSWLQIVLNNGVYSPYYFFVISGFLIMNSYPNKKNKNPTHWKSYFVRRFFRIFPVLWVTILLSLVLNIFPYSVEVLKNAFLISFITPYLLEKIPVFVSWSIFVELTYYLVTPLIANKLNLLFALVEFLFFICTHWFYFEYRHQFYDFNNLIWDMPFSTFSYFFGGILIYYLNLSQYFHRRYWPRLNGALVDILVIASFTQVMITQGSGLLITGFFLLITTLVETSLIGKVLWNRKALQFLGTRCYSIYLTHSIAINIANSSPFDIFNHFSLTDNSRIVFQYFWILLLVVLFAEIIYQTIEKPWIQFGKNLTHQTSEN
jgi:exopolysaccharide production protein ExoZ